MEAVTARTYTVRGLLSVTAMLKLPLASVAPVASRALFGLASASRTSPFAKRPGRGGPPPGGSATGGGTTDPAKT
mgnify:CR=1 FL=1